MTERCLLIGGVLIVVLSIFYCWHVLAPQLRETWRRIDEDHD